MKSIADTGYIVAAGSREDTYHRWAIDLARGLTEPLLTCEAVLAESATRGIEFLCAFPGRRGFVGGSV